MDLRRNIELKAFDAAPDTSLDVCRSIEAVDHGVLWQRDTYFEARHGRLKLREESPGQPHLIQYERPDEPQQRESSYRIVAVSDADQLRVALAAALGVHGVVEKQRRIFLWRRVRIHLDEVTGLGHFIELEAVASAGSDLSKERELIVRLRRAFGITDELLCARGYVDAVLRQGAVCPAGLTMRPTRCR